MLSKLYWTFSQKLGGNQAGLNIEWNRKSPGSWLTDFFQQDLSVLPSPPLSAKIEDLALKASMLGDMPLWEGFEKLEDYPFPVKNATRNANQVRVDKQIGDLFFNLTVARKPARIVEIGTAFGVSGMYWLSGIEANGSGKLMTFEPNAIWAKVAGSNLSTISSNFVLTISTFEEKHDTVMAKGDTIDIAFIDAIHQSGIVNNQFSLISEYCKAASLILFDDINFSYDMWDCWRKIARSPRVLSSCSVARRLGIVELKG
ncbi:MAG TPA: class I SAM-dependent methyltransferase [Ohtaekwangia sp.]|nr:class I SAM-dependent methyltransferase [Ohtaekwangia sp.]